MMQMQILEKVSYYVHCLAKKKVKYTNILLDSL